MSSELLSNTIYITYVSGTNSKGQDILKTQQFSNVSLEVEDQKIDVVIQAVSTVIGKAVIEAGKIQKYALKQEN